MELTTVLLTATCSRMLGCFLLCKALQTEGVSACGSAPARGHGCSPCPPDAASSPAWLMETRWACSLSTRVLSTGRSSSCSKHSKPLQRRLWQVAQGHKEGLAKKESKSTSSCAALFPICQTLRFKTPSLAAGRERLLLHGASETVGSPMQVTKQCLSPTGRGAACELLLLSPLMARRLSSLPVLLCAPFMVQLMLAEFWLFPYQHELYFSTSPECLSMGEVTAGSFQEVLESERGEMPRCLPTACVGEKPLTC